MDIFTVFSHYLYSSVNWETNEPRFHNFTIILEMCQVCERQATCSGKSSGSFMCKLDCCLYCSGRLVVKHLAETVLTMISVSDDMDVSWMYFSASHTQILPAGLAKKIK